MQRSPKAEWFTNLSRRHRLIDRAVLLDLFTTTTPSTVKQPKLFSEPKKIDDVFYRESPETSSAFYESHYVLVQDSEFVYGVEYDEAENRLKYIVLCEKGGIPINIYDGLILHGEDIDNYRGEPLFTTYGSYLVNQVVLARNFKDKIPYVNGVFNIGKVEGIIGSKVLAGEISPEEVSSYINSAMFLFSFSELIVPVFSKRSLTTDPNIKTKKAELLKKYQDSLDNPVICAKIEDELISMDKKYLQGDPSMGFYGSASKKFNVHRKRQFLAVGLVEEFQKEKGNYAFIDGALSDGWEKKAFPVLCNDIRNGSYNRGIETAQGGVQTKYLLRLFQNTKITEVDCGVTHGLMCKIDQDNASTFYGRYMIIGPGRIEVFTEENASKYFGKEIEFRSTMFCKAHPNLCYKCAGSQYETLDTDALGVRTLEFGSAFLTMAMKAMHGTKLSSIRVTDLDDYFVSGS